MPLPYPKPHAPVGGAGSFVDRVLHSVPNDSYYSCSAHAKQAVGDGVMSEGMVLAYQRSLDSVRAIYRTSMPDADVDLYYGVREERSVFLMGSPRSFSPSSGPVLVICPTGKDSARARAASKPPLFLDVDNTLVDSETGKPFLHMQALVAALSACFSIVICTKRPLCSRGSTAIVDEVELRERLIDGPKLGMEAILAHFPTLCDAPRIYGGRRYSISDNKHAHAALAHHLFGADPYNSVIVDDDAEEAWDYVFRAGRALGGVHVIDPLKTSDLGGANTIYLSKEDMFALDGKTGGQFSAVYRAQLQCYVSMLHHNFLEEYSRLLARRGYPILLCSTSVGPVCFIALGINDDVLSALLAKPLTVMPGGLLTERDLQALLLDKSRTPITVLSLQEVRDTTTGSDALARCAYMLKGSGLVMILAEPYVNTLESLHPVSYTQAVLQQLTATSRVTMFDEPVPADCYHNDFILVSCPPPAGSHSPRDGRGSPVPLKAKAAPGSPSGRRLGC